MVVHTPIVSRWAPRGGLDSELLSPRTPAHACRQGLALSGRYAATPLTAMRSSEVLFSLIGKYTFRVIIQIIFSHEQIPCKC